MATPTRLQGGRFTSVEDELGRRAKVPPELAVELRAHSIATLAELRKTRGDNAGNRGPRACMLAGYETPLDGGEGVFIWDYTSVAADDGGTSTVLVAGVEQGRWRRAQLYPTQHAALLQSTIVTAAGTSTIASNPNTVLARIRIWGSGGGGGGGAGTPGAPFANFGGGGGAGGYLEAWTSVIPASWSYTLGAAGTGGANTGGNGNAGSDSTVSNGSTTWTAKGGNGGNGDATSGGAPRFVIGGLQTALSTNGNVNGNGAAGWDGIMLSGTQALSGRGGSNALGDGGVSRASTNTGANGVAPGTGGSGAMVLGTGTGRAGGDGAVGVIVIEEFG